ncbi:MAG: hypothetical protein K0S76_2084, partial [Herbinix sp.]|nr:hypothetical protein [Herbinix sp.]
LRNVTVVSNVTDSKTGQYPFLENMLITRKMKTDSGKEVEVTVGIIGQTIPTLTSKTHSYAGILKTEDMVLNAQTQAKKLKEMGADIVVALSHTGIGPENPELNFKNVAYALTKIPEVDVVVCGHEHNLFPTTDMTSPYFKLPGVDKKTFLMNGKNVIMAGDRGRAVGIVDLTLEVSGDDVKIVERKSDIRRVTETIKEDASIASNYGDWEDRLLQYSTDVIGTLGEGEDLQNYFGLLGDNTAIQLLNDSKINYVLKYINTTGKTYINYPIIAASTYASYGAASIDNFISIHDSITEANLSELQPYNNYLYIYTITGQQLREWLEWTASAYETITEDTNWSNQTMKDLMKASGMKSLIREEWLDDWSNFYIFDGVDYVINPSNKPRYDFSGNKISNSRRVESVKYQGTEISDSTILLIATDKITKPVDANMGVEKQVVLNGFNRGQLILSNYVKQLSAGKSLLPHVDYNWKVKMPKDYKFIAKVPFYAHDLFVKAPWYVDDLTEMNKYRYYTASFPMEIRDATAPHIVAAPLVTNATATQYELAVTVSDASRIKAIKYLYGKYDSQYGGWPVATDISKQNITVRRNGTYSIFAEDINGNKAVLQVEINNFRDDMLSKPTVISYTNRKTKISGTAEPGSTVIFDAYTGTYECETGTSGSFSYALPAQPSGSLITVYAKDNSKGLESERVMVTVKRTGPNQPSINPVYNNAGFVTGDTNDTDAQVLAVIGNKVYVSNQGGKELYEKNTEIYDPTLKIVETKLEMINNGLFIMNIPAQQAETSFTIYSIDHLSRNSRSVTVNVMEAAPNAPVVYEVSNIEKSLNGYIPTKEKKIYDILLTIGDKMYQAQTDKSGNFSYQLEEQLKAGQLLKVTVYDNKNGIIRTNSTEIIVNDIESYVINNSSELTINEVSSKSYIVKGTYLANAPVYIAISSGTGENFTNKLIMVETDEFDNYRYRIEEILEEGMNIYVMARFTDGKILIANKTVVLPEKPEAPQLIKSVSNSDKLVQIAANKNCEVALTIGTKVYKTTVYQYDETTKRYIYSFVTDRDQSGTKITIIATNVVGSSEIVTSTIIKVAPDSPQIDAVKAGDQVLKGKINLIGSDTKAYAQIGSKKYVGTIDKKGNLEIKIPKQKAGTTIKVWGTNNAGRGPLTVVKVVE